MRYSNNNVDQRHGLELHEGVAHASDFFSLKLPNCGLILFMP